MVATLLIGPFYLHGAFALDMGTVGLMISMGPCWRRCPACPPAGWWTGWGRTPWCASAWGSWWWPPSCWPCWTGRSGPLGYLLPILLLTAGYALFQTANNSAVVGRRRGEPGAVAGLLTLSRNLGQLTGAAGLGPVRRPGGRPDLPLATADELAFATRVTFAPDGLAADECALVGGKGGACRAG